MFCTKCGNQLADTAMFCPKCGNQVKSKEEAPQADSASGTPTPVPPTPTPTPTPVPPTPVPQPPSNVGDDSLALRYKENFKYCFVKQYVGFSGRASRNEYLKFSLVTTAISAIIYLLVSLITLGMDSITALLFGSIIGYCATGIWSLIALLPALGVTVRRLHDNGYSGWWYFIVLVPIIGGLWLLYLTLKENNLSDNQYGKPVHYRVLTEAEAKQLNVPYNGHKNETIIVLAVIIVCYGLSGLISGSAMSSSTTSSSFNAPKTTTKSTAQNTDMTKDNTTTAKPVEAPKAPPVDPNVAIANEAKDVLLAYHAAITNQNIPYAYSMLTEHRKQVVGGLESMRRGYATTISSEIVDAKPSYVDPNKVVFQYKLNAKDALDGRIKLQTFTGDVTMVKMNGQWYMDDMTGRLVGSSYQ